MTDYVVATTKPWNVSAFHAITPRLSGTWHLVERPEDILGTVLKIQPRYLFFPHWSWKVPPDVLKAVECIGFHMTDLPFGRGGSPLQNLILRGRRTTKLSAFQLGNGLDRGPVYLRRELSLAGRAQDIYERAAGLVYEMIEQIISETPKPVPQRGRPTVFRRRQPADSACPNTGSLKNLYDHVRMLDADTYPRAFIDHGAFRFVFSDSELDSDGKLYARVEISRRSRSGS